MYAVVSALVLALGASGCSDSDGPGASAPSSTSAAAATTTSASATSTGPAAPTSGATTPTATPPTSPVTTAPTSPPASRPPATTRPPSSPPAPARYTGRFDDTITVRKPTSEAYAVATVSTSGRGGFRVSRLDGASRVVETLVDVDGRYRGTVLLPRGSNTERLQIDASGWWSVVVKPLTLARQLNGSAVSGSGDDVLVYLGDNTVAALRHRGDGRFVATFSGSRAVVLASTVGTYSAEKVIPGTGVLRIRTTGTWSVTPGQ